MQNRLWLNLCQTPPLIRTLAIVCAYLATVPAWSQTSMNPIGSKAVSSFVNASPLDGRQFTAGIVRLGANKTKNNPLGDVLIFSKGMFSSAVCKKYNFVEAPYFIRLDGNKIHFLVELKSPTDGRMIWKGTIRGNDLEGTMRWTKKRWYWTIDAEHTIRGKLEKKLITSAPLPN